jgi:uncharacterized protein (DUF697 family)
MASSDTNATTASEAVAEAVAEATPQSRTDRGNTIIQRYTLGALAPGLIPLPLVDLAALTGIQLAMLGHLSKIYEVEFTRNLGKSLIGALVGNSTGVVVAPTVASLFKLVPGLGSIYGGASVAVVGAAVTYAVGKVFQMHFEAGGNFLNFDPEKMRGYFAEQLEEGKKVASQMKKS